MRRSLLALVLLASLTACSDDPARTSVTTTEAPAATTAATTTTAAPDDLVEGAPADEGMDATKLEGAKTYAFEPGKNTQGVVVVRHGTIVAEWYAPGADQDSWAASWSMSKSVASALVGIAIDEGKIPSLDVPMTTYYPDWAETGRGDITLRDVLEMSPGLTWEENYSPSSLDTSDVINMVVRESDQLAYAASRPAEVPPGTAFVYSSGTSMLLSGVLQQATGMEARDYAQQKLWDRIGVDQVEMWTDAEGHTLTYCCVDTTSRGFARFGQLFLDDGAWGSEQVVPESWVAASVAGSRAGSHDVRTAVVARRRLRCARGHVLGAGPRRPVHLRDPEPRPRCRPQRHLCQGGRPAGGRSHALRSLPERWPHPRQGHDRTGPVGRQRIPHADRRVDQRLTRPDAPPPNNPTTPQPHNPNASEAGAFAIAVRRISGGELRDRANERRSVDRSPPR
ncbi:MAG: serine hydrolase [Microthrixaceae bacterium]